MKSLVVLLVIAGVVHLFIHVPVFVAVILALFFWGLWKLRWIVLGILGLEMLFGGGGDNGGDVT